MVLDSFRLDGKIALVTGSSRGLGQGAAVALAEAGADVALLNRAGAEETAEKVHALGRKVHVIEQDLGLATPQELDESVQSVVEALGR
ncbi:SDR family NAD(P)-dependent oxidoreductase, partial [Paenarthrobacter sp.]|uniref:SDR family NAD(P)-dependent oxidoreductase n=1 Tax=Paenarthrobacter sp. TaxID=1931993 RepID=UPI0028118B8A